MRALLGITAALLTLTAVPASADPVERCRIADKRIGELSGLAADGRNWYAMNDGGTRLTVYVLNKSCAVQRTITNSTDPFDVEDLARGADGTLWLADTGDNRKQRETVALHALNPNGKSTLYRLTYPDGPHDVEALLLDRNNVPYLVSKEPFGEAKVYRPAGKLSAPGPTPLEKVGAVSLRSTSTPGGPVGAGIGSILVTGGAVNADGTVVALRTYTEAYLFSAPDGDIAAALARKPVRVSLPNEEQGEAIAFDSDGSLLSGTEGKNQPIRAVEGAVELARGQGGDQRTDPTPTSDGSSQAQPPAETGSSSLGAFAVAGLLALGVVLFFSRRKRNAS
ncbi:LPXTG cell wall anchor domain-containing protein [Allokutzneria sp. A3M-2-11 16]|uniref:LPXTG cell wall anchor domain-containing protein n=1 Tax=Allokutzneria sp. A3M-2-11 16 TaxID=2962043 RepID=UPI0035A8C8F8